MVEYKVSTSIVVPVILTATATGLPASGVDSASVTVSIVHLDGSVVTFTPISSGAFVGSGYYNLTIPSTYTAQAGILQYGVSVPTIDTYFGVVYLVAKLELDTFTAVTRVLALSYDNVVQDQQVYDSGKRLTSARLRCYDSAAHALAAGTTGLLYTYAIAATYSSDGTCTNFSMTQNP
jgi:hypothetical protein